MMLKNRWKKAACLILTIISAVCLGKVDVKAADYWPDAPETLSPSVILMEESTGTILYEKNSDEAHYPASITKIMTTLLALENGNLSDMVTFSDDAINNTEGSGIARDYGEQMTLEQCLYGVMLESANECAYAVAEHVGGTVENFVDMMNAKAKELGCTNTHFANPHGLQDENHYTTAHDMALIAQAAYQNETFRIIIGTKMYTIPPTNKHAEETVLRNHHDMLCTYHNANRKYLYPYCVGGKTGYTATANSTLVTYAEKDGMTLICVVMNTQSPNQFIDTVNLFDYAFDNFQVLNVAENDTNYSAETTVDNGNLDNIAPFVELDKDAVIVLPKTAEFSDTSSSVEYNDSDPEIAGSITYTYAGRNVGKADIKTTGVVVEGYAFDNESTEEEEQEAVSTVQVRPIVVVLLIVAVILLGVLLFFLKRFYDNYYIIKHNRAVRRDRKDQKRRIRKKRRRRRRWR
ncbi:D-alanyl-D-alanine carboxypeptidase family protein [Roseburia inulinivorans]|uniref:D-alanyl-D-alanine carboxypeptidase dacB n=1 Tax=Roseburia inulinivorans TaxID=360807 RepID=A0A173VU32_9FIRM|nr:D-alanyl-D-alanine carboxypeptidase family protein [Roseburia inulinivorans]CUN29468.1 D-alanyl-D-alanine carboxypeptidase dacB precursor [Roseburia inulinivorans]